MNIPEADNAIYAASYLTVKAIKELVKKFKEKMIYLPYDETVANFSDISHKEELKIYKEYISDKKIMFLMKIGIALRYIDNNKIEYERNKILKKHKVEGLHIAEACQNKIIIKMIEYYIENGYDKKGIKEAIERNIKDVEYNYFFIQRKEKIDRMIIKISRILDTKNPDIITISSMKGAFKKAKKIVDAILKEHENDYEVTLYSEDYIKIYFVIKKN